MSTRYRVVARHPQADAFEVAGEGVLAFHDRATAVSHARRRSCAGLPCDVVDTATGELVYRREMDLDASRAQRGLFS